jgi:predicted nucleic-acid-binding Zn-ribbon protein
MSTNQLCPKCHSNQFTIDENDLDFITITADVSQGIITPGITLNDVLKLTCSSCGYQYKSGEYEKQVNVEAARLAFMATQNGNQMKAVIIYALLAVFMAFAGYKFFLIDWKIFGFIFSAVAFLLSIIAITGFILTPKKK